MDDTHHDEIHREDSIPATPPSADEKETRGRLTAKDEIGGVKFDHLGKEYVWVTPESLSSRQ